MRLAAKAGLWVRLAVIGLILAVLVSAAVQQTVRAQSEDSTPAGDTAQIEAQPSGEVILYYFWSSSCSHCLAAKPFLEDLVERYPQLTIRDYELHDPTNQEAFVKMTDAFSVPGPHGTPTFFIGDGYIIGYSEDIGVQIEAAVKNCAENSCADAGAGILDGTGDSTFVPEKPPVVSGEGANTAITLPLIGTVNLASQSLFLSTALISFVDGFNPCSLWVLSMLLALTLHTGSRKKVLIIGLIFLTVTAAVYAMFIAGLFTMISVMNFTGWIQIVVALVALFFALVNIKDYFWYKEGISFTISDQHKPGIFQRIRNVMDASQSFWGLAGATVVMAAGVSLVEFSCTAGLPVVWTNLVAAQNVEPLAFVLLLLLYMVIYQLDELVIFGGAVYSLKASRMEEKHGRILKLIGGMLMLTLSIVMLINPAWMSSLSSTLIVFAIALAGVLLVLLVHRSILPSMGIWIGTEKAGKKKSRKRAAHKAARH